MDISNREQRRFGTAGPFANLFQEAWKEDLHVFAAEGGKQGQEGDVQRLGVPERASSDTLNRHPVEVFAVEETSTSVTLTADRYWARWMDKCKSHNLPDYVIVSTPPQGAGDGRWPTVQAMEAAFPGLGI